MTTQANINQVLFSMSSMPNAPEITPALIREYHTVLGQWDDETLELAALHYKSTETFFPTPGALNNKVLDMQMIAAGIPTAAEAWGQVIGGLKIVDTVLCQEGFDLRNAITGTGEPYFKASREYNHHRRVCTICKDGGLVEEYSHPVVAETVRLLGGRSMLITDNPAADRKQFIDAYRERVALEGRKFIMPQKVKNYIEEKQYALTSAPIKQLAEGMRK